MVVVVIVVAWPCRPRSRCTQDASSDADDEQTRDERQPGVELLGDDEAREQERHEPESEDAGGVRHGHRRSERDRVAGPAARAHRYPATSAFP